MGLPLSEQTLPDVLNNVDYKTKAIGKWHLGAHKSLVPEKRGFDEFFGFLIGGHRYFPEDLTLNDLSENVPDTKIDHLSGDINENNIPAGVSIENASYMESNNEEIPSTSNSTLETDQISEEHTPKLFSDENDAHNEESLVDTQTEKLFDQDVNEEEDFEIPAFLRKQKF